MQKKFTLKALIGVVLMMTFGTGTMVAAKTMLLAKSVDHEGNDTGFEKAMYQSLLMFLAMALCYPIYLVIGVFKKLLSSVPEDDEEDILSPEEIKAKKANSLKGHLYIAAPAFCDLVATTMMTTGLIFIPVSVMQMLRGSMVIFSALLTIFVRKRKLHGFEWFGIFLCCLALLLVGAASINNAELHPDYNKWFYPLIGIVLVIASQAVQALQIIIEEILLADVKLPSLIVVGMEGVWGSLMCIFCFIPLFFFLPGSDHGRYEDTYDTFYKVFTNTTLAVCSIIYFISILFLNWGGMIVTEELTAVHRTIFEAFRTMFIWIVSIILHYEWTSDFGEPWNNWSYMQLVGFLVLVSCMLVYNRAIKLVCFFTYPDAEAVPSVEEKDNLKQPTNWADQNDINKPLLE